VDYEGVEQTPLKEQIKNILLNGTVMLINHCHGDVFDYLAVVITFSQLCQLLGNNKPSDQVLQCLAVMATLVRCCWVVKRYERPFTLGDIIMFYSEILYKEGSSSDINGIPYDILRLARDQMVRMVTMVHL